MKTIFKIPAARTIMLYLFLLSIAAYVFSLEIYYLLNASSPLYNIGYLAVYDDSGNRLNLDEPISIKPNGLVIINRLACTTKKIDVTISKELIGPINTKTAPFALELASVDMHLNKGCQPMRAIFRVPPGTANGEYNYYSYIAVTPVPLLTIKQNLPEINFNITGDNNITNSQLNTKVP